jgi:hypothetical protein
MKKLLLLPCLLIAVISLGQTKLTIQSPFEKCATVISNLDEIRHFGDQGFQAARDTTNYTSRGGPFRCTRSFLQFDLSSIPQGSFLNWAKLTLFLVKSNGANACLFRRITSPWDPNTVTWNTQPTTSRRGTVKFPVSGIVTFFFLNIDVWKLVQPMIDSPSNSFGFALKLDSEQSKKEMGELRFYSPADRIPRFYPKLVLEYTAPGLQQKVTSMSVDLSGASTDMNIYPNPSNGIFNCNIKSTEANLMTLRVIDMLGRTVYSQPVNTSTLQMRVNLSTSSAGTYFIILQDNKNATIVSQQLQVN